MMRCSLSSVIAPLEGKLVLSQAAEGLIKAALAPYQRRFTVVNPLSVHLTHSVQLI